VETVLGQELLFRAFAVLFASGSCW
jgi:hypothetical protein